MISPLFSSFISVQLSFLKFCLHRLRFMLLKRSIAYSHRKWFVVCWPTSRLVFHTSSHYLFRTCIASFYVSKWRFLLIYTMLRHLRIFLCVNSISSITMVCVQQQYCRYDHRWLRISYICLCMSFHLFLWEIHTCNIRFVFYITTVCFSGKRETFCEHPFRPGVALWRLEWCTGY